MVFRALTVLFVALSGGTALVFQTVWQKYLSFLVGSESKSISLVVAIFLFGLATGYRYWGSYTARNQSRSQLFKTYGLLEAGIGAYALLFSLWYHAIEAINGILPASILSGIVVSLLVLFIPTFIMGASIPMLTKALPENESEINSTHAWVYGFNTLGAFVGVMVGAFVFLPGLGMSTSLIVAGLLNLTVGAFFWFYPVHNETIHARSAGQKQTETLDHRIIAAVVCVTGAVTLSLEVLLVRIMSLSVGSAYFVFPVVLGTFVLCLALGSLSYRERRPATKSALFFTLLTVLVAMLTVYAVIPYLPYWMHNIRASLTSVETNYPVYVFIVGVVFMLISLPMLFGIGRCLPLAYALLDKNCSDYGRKCGNLYFFNTIGNVVGAVVLGHVLLYWFNIDHIFRFLLCAVSLTLVLLLFERRRYIMIGMSSGLAIGLLFLPLWRLDALASGMYMFRYKNNFSFQGVFSMPEVFRAGSKILYHDDGPNTTAGVIAFPPKAGKPPSLSVTVNAKSDGNTHYDYNTVANLSLLPYLFAPRQKDMKVSVIGMGTAITAGFVGAAPGVAELSVVEISPKIIEAAKFFDGHSLNMTKNPKIKIFEMDAYRFFRQSKTRFDLVISEPSNPWVAGIENLYTPKFYELAKKSMTEDGVFVQWIHTYSMDKRVLLAVLNNVYSSFKHVRFYRLASADYGILASQKPLTGQR